MEHYFPGQMMIPGAIELMCSREIRHSVQEDDVAQYERDDDDEDKYTRKSQEQPQQEHLQHKPEKIKGVSKKNRFFFSFTPIKIMIDVLVREHVAQKYPKGALTTKPTRSDSLSPNKPPVKHCEKKISLKKKKIPFLLPILQTEQVVH